MKTVLFSPLYLTGKDPFGSDRLERNIRWVRWYAKIKEEIGFDAIWMCDNGSDPERLRIFKKTFPGVNIHEFPHIERAPGDNGYQWCWRALYFLRLLVDHGYEKIITIDSDTFVVSKRLAAHIKGLITGWSTFWGEKYRFPLAECHVLCADSFPRMFGFTANHWKEHLGQLMETRIPFTNVETEFVCDRFGESREIQRPNMDLYSQAPIGIQLEFGRFG